MTLTFYYVSGLRPSIPKEIGGAMDPLPAQCAAFGPAYEPLTVKRKEAPMQPHSATNIFVSQWSILESGQRASYKWRESRSLIYHDADSILEELTFLEPDIVAKLEAYMSLYALVDGSLSLDASEALDDELRNRMAVIDILHSFAANDALPAVASEARDVIEKRANEPLRDMPAGMRRIAVAEKADFMHILAQIDRNAALNALAREPNPYLRELLTAAVEDGLDVAQARRN